MRGNCDTDEHVIRILILLHCFYRFADSYKLFDKTGASDETIQRSEFIMQQLLLLCGCFDYSDEIGRYLCPISLCSIDCFSLHLEHPLSYISNQPEMLDCS